MANSEFIPSVNHTAPMHGITNDATQTPTVPRFDPTTKRMLVDVNSENSGIGIPEYDYVAYTNTNATTDTYVFKTGGSGGTTVATVVIVYVDSTKEQISTVTKT